jgi:catechol 1,2-dioxygenase
MDGDARLHAIWLASVDRMKDVVREFRITQDELHAAGDYFNRLGVSGMSRSLIDVALAMTSVEATGGADTGTRPNLEGPYHAPHPERGDGILLDRDPGADAPRLVLEGVVRDAATGAAVPGARLDFWQADSDGLYDRAGHHLRGIVATDGEGRYRIETVVPSDYAEHDHDPIGELFRAMGKHNTRAAHIHLKASVAGRVLLTTQIFMSSSTFLDKDYVEGAVTDDLVAQLVPDGAGRFRAVFDVALAGVAEAVA